MQSPASSPDCEPSTHRDRDSPASVSLQMKQQYSIANQRTPPTPDVRLYHRAVVVAQDTPGTLFLTQLTMPYAYDDQLQSMIWALALLSVVFVALVFVVFVFVVLCVGDACVDGASCLIAQW